jgi:hypothetical protein
MADNSLPAVKAVSLTDDVGLVIGSARQVSPYVCIFILRGRRRRNIT